MTTLRSLSGHWLVALHCPIWGRNPPDGNAQEADIGLAHKSFSQRLDGSLLGGDAVTSAGPGDAVQRVARRRPCAVGRNA